MSQNNETIVGAGADKAWAHEVIELYTQGCSDSEVAASLRVTLKEYYKQIQDSPTFAQLVEFGRTLSQAHWEGIPRKHMFNKQMNGPVYAFYMKNKFGWADKTESITTDTASMDLDQVRADAMRRVEDFIKRNTPELTDAKRVMTELQVVK